MPDTSRDILMETADTYDAAVILKKAYANVLVRLELAGTYGVYVVRLRDASFNPAVKRVTGGFGVYLGRHDDKPMPRSELAQIQKRLS